MSQDADIAALPHAALVALVYQLRHQLAERDQQIADLKRQLAQMEPDTAPVSSQPATPSPPPGPLPGSLADLFAHLEQLYPEGE